MARFTPCDVCGKAVYELAWQATLAAVKLATKLGQPAKWYWSPGCRSYHVTSHPKGERGRVRPL